MNELIKIQNRDGKETVSARELHNFLEVQTKFKDWIKIRIEKFDFVENQDFIKVAEKIATSGGPQDTISYFISIEMAKELSMVENNEKGKQARRYFIECEKKLKAVYEIPQTYAQALMLAAKQAEQIEEQQRLIAMQTPMVEFVEKYVETKSTQNIRDTAKVFGISQKIFIEKLIDYKVLYRDQAGKLKPYADTIEKGLMVLKTGAKEGINFTQARFTAKGIEAISIIIQQGNLL